MSLESYLRAAPKAHLHAHLEGSILPETLLTLARRNGVALPADSVEGLRAWFTFRDFDHFIEIYLTITRCLRTVEDYELIAYEFGAEMARQHTRYAEVTFSPSTHEALGVPFDTQFAGLTRGRERARNEFGVEMAWIFDIVRNIRRRSGARSWRIIRWRGRSRGWAMASSRWDWAARRLAIHRRRSRRTSRGRARRGCIASRTRGRRTVRRASGGRFARWEPSASGMACARLRTRRWWRI